MKRPLYTAAAAWMLGELFAENRNCLQAVSLVFLFVIWIKRKLLKTKDFILIELSVVLVFLFLGRYALTELKFKYEQYAVLPEKQHLTVEGTVLSTEERGYGWQVILTADRATLDTGKLLPDNIRLLLEFEEQPDLKIGNKICVKGSKKEFYPCTNKGNFNEKEYYYEQKIALKLKVHEYTVKNHSFSEIREELQKIRKLLCANIDRACNNREASVLKAVIYGEKSELEQETKDLYVKNGIAHILAVSGLHMSIVGMGIYRLFRKKFTFFTSGIISFAVILCFGIMTGFGVSVKRAVYMMLLQITADLFGRKYDFKSAVSFSMLLILVENPYAIYSASFLLSGSAMVSLGFIYPEFELWFFGKKRQKKNFKKESAKSVLSGFLLWLVGLPAVACFYFEIPTYSVFLNLLILPMLSVLFLSGMAASFLMAVFPQAGIFVCGIGVFCVKICNFLCSQAEKLPYASVVIGKPTFLKVGFFYGSLLVFIAVMRFYKTGRSIYRKLFLSCCFFAVLLFVIFLRPQHQALFISVIDVGQGDCILVENENGHTYLIDSGSSSIKNAAKYKVIPYLKSRGIARLDYVMVSHGDDDHINGILEMIEEDMIKICNLVLPDCRQFKEAYRELVVLAEAKGISVCYVQENTSLKDNTLSIDIISPDNGIYHDINEASMVMKLSYYSFSMYFTGDIGIETEKRLLPLLTHADIIKVPHHGSKNSSSWEFLEKITPCLAVVSCGANNRYGHPHMETVERYKAVCTQMFTTAETGCIEIEVPKRKKGTDYYVTGYLLKSNNGNEEILYEENKSGY